MKTTIYSVPGMHCGHCKAAVTRELEAVAGVEAVDVDLETKLVTVRGDELDGAALRGGVHGRSRWNWSRQPVAQK